MKEKILQFLFFHPGACKRNIASLGCHVWQCNVEFLRAMIDLEKEGRIYAVTINDPANMEFYDKFYLTNK